MSNNTTTAPPSVPIDVAGTVMWSIIGTFTIIINAIILGIIISRKKLHTPTNVITGSMFFSDILLAVVYIFPRWANPYFFHNWLYCSMTSVFAPLVTSLINMHLMAASLDKLLATQFAIRYRVHARARYAFITVAIIWIIVLFVAFIPLFTYRPLYPGYCYPWHYAEHHKEAIYNFVVIGIFFILPLLVMVACYSRIYVIARASTMHKKFNHHGNVEIRYIKKHYKVARVLGILVLAYFIMWMPFLICYSITLVYLPQEIGARFPGFFTGLKVSQYLAFTYPAVNPILYGYFIPTIRKYIIRSVCKRNSVKPITVESDKVLSGRDTSGLPRKLTVEENLSEPTQ